MGAHFSNRDSALRLQSATKTCAVRHTLAKHVSRPKASPHAVKGSEQHTLVRWIGVLLVLVYFFKATVLPWFLHVPTTVLLLANVLALALGTGVALVGGGRCRWSWILVLFAFAVGITSAEQTNPTALRWLGLAMLILAVGPLILNPAAIDLRAAAWKLTENGLPTLTAMFALWYLLQLPSYGAGFFTSFMAHCMLLGPIAGLGVGVAAARALHIRSWRWGLLAVAGVIPVLASGSRVATFATVAGVCFLLIRRKPVLGIVALILSLTVTITFVRGGRDVDKSTETLTGALAYKGNVNSRAELWESRLEEFRGNPLFGVGIGMGSGSGATVEANGSIRIEPGSCYLAILAMTGGLGSVAFLSALGLVLFAFATSRQKFGLEKDILSIVGIYLGVHGIAEGWILSFGNPLCFLFWLWLGKLGDVAIKPVPARNKRRLRPLQQLRAQPAVSGP